MLGGVAQEVLEDTGEGGFVGDDGDVLGHDHEHEMSLEDWARPLDSSGDGRTQVTRSARSHLPKFPLPDNRQRVSPG